MVTVELRAHRGPTTQSLATLVVHADATWTVEGNTAAFERLFQTPIPTGPHQWVTFDDDPAEWARRLPSELRTGYLTAHVTES